MLILQFLGASLPDPLHGVWESGCYFLPELFVHTKFSYKRVLLVLDRFLCKTVHKLIAITNFIP